jgi:hypothetical protein
MNKRLLTFENTVLNRSELTKNDQKNNLKTRFLLENDQKNDKNE